MGDIKKLVMLPARAEELLERYLDKRRMRERFGKEADAITRDAVGKPKPRQNKPQRPKVPRTTPIRVELTCIYCKKKFWKHCRIERQRKKTGRGGPYCSRECSFAGQRKTYDCLACGVTFMSLKRTVGVHLKGEVYCSEECHERYLRSNIRWSRKEFDEFYSLKEKTKQDCRPLSFIQQRTLQAETYCHHCIDHDATCELLLNKRWMAICDKCRKVFMANKLVCVSFPSFGESIPWPTGSKRKPMLHELDRRGSKVTMDTGLMMLTLEWTRS